MAAWPVDRLTPARRVGGDRQTQHFDVIDRARALESQVVWVSSNLTGRWGGRRFLGHAKVVDPDGRVLAATGHREGVALARLDARARIGASRIVIDHLADRRPAAYAARLAELPAFEAAQPG